MRTALMARIGVLLAVVLAGQAVAQTSRPQARPGTRPAPSGAGHATATTTTRPSSGAAPARGPQADALTIYSAGLEAVLADPKDQGVLRALRMLDDRVLELPNELNQPEVPGPAIQLALDLLFSPMNLRAGMLQGGDPQGGPPFYAQWNFFAAKPEQAQEWAGRFAATIGKNIHLPAEPAPDLPGVTKLNVQGVPVYYGPAKAGDKPAFSLALNKLDQSPLNLNSTGLPQGVKPAFALTFDAQQIQPLLQMFMGHGGPQVDAVRTQLEMMGLYGPDAIKVSAVTGYAADRAHLSARYSNYRKLMEKSKSLSDQRISAADLHRIPADAVCAQVAKVNMNSIGNAMRAMAERMGAQSGRPVDDPMAMIEQHTGINPQRDIFDHLGQTFGIYMSDTTGGGGLMSTVAFIEVKDPDALNQSIVRINAMVNDLARQHAKGYVRIAEKTFGDQHLTLLTFPGLPVPLEVSFAIVDGYLYAGASPQAALAAIKQAKSGKTTLSDNARFKEMGGDAGNLKDAIKVSFMDTPRLIGSGYGLVSLGAAALANAVRSPIDQAREPGLIMPSYSDLANGAKAAVTISRIEGDDLVVTGQCDRSVLVNMCGGIGVFGGSSTVVAAAVAAGVVMPAIGKAREAAVATRSMASLKNISIGMMTYGAEFNDAVPPSAQTLVDKDYIPADLLHSPVGPVPDGKGDFFFNLNIKKFSDSKNPNRHVLGYDRALLAKKGKAVVVFYDGHVEQMDADQFQHLISQPPNAGVDFKLPG